MKLSNICHDYLWKLINALLFLFSEVEQEHTRKIR